MQPDLRMHICEHIIRVLQHQKDVNQKQHICVKHDFVAGRRAVLLPRWIVRSVPLEIVGSSGHEKVPTCGKPGLERPGRPRGERIEGSCGKHLWSPSDSFNDTNRRRRSNCSTNNFQTPSRSKSLIQAPFPRTPFNTGTSATASTVVPSQINVECHRLAKCCV
ncbi:hypothetical protein TNCV_2573851 [Trichonephila clavipes]|nr:hypothetical protein TNCV_2573851 [Trichonephila clavipes]